MEVYLETGERCREQHAKEEFGDWSKDYSYRYKDFTSHRHMADGIYDPIEIDFQPDVWKEYFAVYVQYSTGDSFGRASGVRVVLCICERIEQAEAIQHLITKDAEQPYSYETAGNTIKLMDQKLVIYTGQWKGYFESFHECGIHRTTFIG